VDGDHKASTDELVQFDVVDMATGAQLRSVLDDEDVVRVDAELGHGIALDAGPDGQGVEAEHLRQHPSGLLIPAGDIDPDESVVTGKQPLQLPDRMLLDAVIGHKANVHLARHLLEAVIPALSLAPPRPRRLNSRAEHAEDCGGPGRGRPEGHVIGWWQPDERQRRGEDSPAVGVEPHTRVLVLDLGAGGPRRPRRPGLRAITRGVGPLPANEHAKPEGST
jgi:hypothetical protein